MMRITVALVVTVFFFATPVQAQDLGYGDVLKEIVADLRTPEWNREVCHNFSRYEGAKFVHRIMSLNRGNRLLENILGIETSEAKWLVFLEQLNLARILGHRIVYGDWEATPASSTCVYRTWVWNEARIWGGGLVYRLSVGSQSDIVHALGRLY